MSVQGIKQEIGGKPYKSSGGKMVWNEEVKKEIPERWEVAGIEKFGTLGSGITYDKRLGRWMVSVSKRK